MMLVHFVTHTAGPCEVHIGVAPSICDTQDRRKRQSSVVDSSLSIVRNTKDVPCEVHSSIVA